MRRYVLPLLWLLVAFELQTALSAKVSDAPKLIGLLDELSHPEETNATITCSVGSGDLSSLTYEWFKDEQRLSNQQDKVRVEIPADNYQSVLRIFNLSQSDSAVYTCVASNRFGQDKIATKLTVKVQLKWAARPPAELKLPVGKLARIPCRAVGSPAPKVEWRKLADAANSKSESFFSSDELRFNSLEQKHGGQYECRASNGADEDLVTLLKLSVSVSKAPKIVDLIERLNHPEGTNATITCSLGSGDLLGLTYEWFKNDERLQPGGSQKIRIDIPPENYQSTLRVFNLEPLDGGVYSCVARNRFGQDKISTKLNVKVQLKWQEQPKDSVASVGQRVYVPCLATGQPPPKVEWQKLSDDQLELVGPELRFASIKPQHSGHYECRASNGVEEDLVARIKLNVLE